MKLFLVYFLSSFGFIAYIISKHLGIDHPTTSLAFTRLISPKINQVILLNGFVAALFGFIGFNFKVYFGELREIEKFDIIDKCKHKILSFAFILIILSEEALTTQLLGILVILNNSEAIFILLLALSIFHWLAIKRSEYLITENQGNYKGHLKISLFFLQLVSTDLFLLYNFYDSFFVLSSSRKSENHVVALLTFEVLILFLRSCSPIIKYFVNLAEIATYSTYESKQTVFSIIECIFSLLGLASELYLFVFIYKTFGAPLHLILETLETVISICRTFMQMYNSIVLVKRLSKLPDVTEDDIRNIDSTCLICLNEIKSGKKISCGHIFHHGCLKSWIQGNVNQFCPKCKKPIKIDENPIKVNGSFGLDPMANEYAQNILNSNEEETVKLEKLNDLAFSFENDKIVKQYNDIKSDLEKEYNCTLSHYETIKKIFEEIIYKNSIFKSKIGAVEYGLPREALPFKSKELTKLKKKINLINLISFGKTKHSFIGFSKNKPSEEVIHFEESNSNLSSIRQSPNKSWNEDSLKSKPVIRPQDIVETNLKPNKEIKLSNDKKEADIPKVSEKDLEKIEHEDEETVRRRQKILEYYEKANSKSKEE